MLDMQNENCVIRFIAKSIMNKISTANSENNIELIIYSERDIYSVIANKSMD